MNKLTNQERVLRVIARGEKSNHAHVVVGDAIVDTKGGNTYITVGGGGAALKHLLETLWINGEEKWSGEHTDIDLTEMPEQVRHGDILLKKIGDRKYQYIQQMVFDPLSKRIEAARD